MIFEIGYSNDLHANAFTVEADNMCDAMAELIDILNEDTENDYPDMVTITCAG